MSHEQVIAAAPDVIIGSWCGKPVRKEKILACPGREHVPAIRDGHVHEVKSTLILQPGPAALTDGVVQMHEILGRIANASLLVALTWPARDGGVPLETPRKPTACYDVHTLTHGTTHEHHAIGSY